MTIHEQSFDLDDVTDGDPLDAAGTEQSDEELDEFADQMDDDLDLDKDVLADEPFEGQTLPEEP